VCLGESLPGQAQKFVFFEDYPSKHRVFGKNLTMIPSVKFKNSYAFFKIAMSVYYIWRYMKMVVIRAFLVEDWTANGLGFIANSV
jgi:hypothetical protein